MSSTQSRSVIAFYSYKGGVGRSMAVANIAILLAQRLRRQVIAVDWDLEAPGLHWFFDIKDFELAGRERVGVLDYLLDWESAVQSNASEAPDVTRYLVSVPVGNFGLPDGAVMLLPAGRPKYPEYNERLAKLNWKSLYEKYWGFAATETLRKQLLDRTPPEGLSGPPIVLLDSRTGITDIAGVCVTQIPDAVVLLLAPNRQSREGIARVANAIMRTKPEDRAERPVPDRFLVLSRLPENEARESTEKWIRDAKEWFESLARNGVFSYSFHPHGVATHRLRHSASWALDERVDPRRDPGSSDPLAEDYEKLASSLASWLRIPKEEYEAVSRLASVLQTREAQFRAELASALQPRNVPKLLEAHLGLAYALIPQGKLDEAKALLQTAHGLALAAGDELARARSRRLLASAIPWIPNALPAIAPLQEALSILKALRDSAPHRREVLEELVAVYERLSSAWAALGDRQQTEEAQREGFSIAEILTSQPKGRRPKQSPQKSKSTLLGDYRSWVAKRHERLLPWFQGASEHYLEEVCIELELDPRPSLEEKLASDVQERSQLKSQGPRRLKELLFPGVAGERAPRWIILGEPGAGKTTLLRSYAYEITKDAEDRERPTPLFISLASVNDPASLDPIRHVVSQWGEGRSTSDREKLQKELEGLRDAGKLALLFDGLDEVAPDKLHALRSELERYSEKDDSHPEYARCPLVICSRPVAIASEELKGKIPIAHVRSLNGTQQHSLLSNLLRDAGAASAVMELLQRNESLAELARNPLMLTLIAVVSRDARLADGTLPENRVKLYGEAVRLLLHRGYGIERKGVKDDAASRALLRALALTLHDQGGEAWTVDQLASEVWKLALADESLLKMLKAIWDSPKMFLEDIGYNSGIVSDHDGPSQPWRFLHRSLREFLAAEALRDLPKAKREEYFQKWKGEAETRIAVAEEEQSEGQKKAKLAQLPDPARWAEVIALLCGLVPDPTEPLEALKSVSPDVMLRALESAETVLIGQSVKLLFTTDWNAWQLLKLLRSRRANPEQARSAVLEHLVPEMPNSILGQAWWALERIAALELSTERQAFRTSFFKKLRPKATRVPVIAWRAIPSGTFQMGCPANESGRLPYDWDRREVSVPSFQLAETVITREQYNTFPNEKDRSANPRFPITGISWWEALLFCAWIDARLPSEAEWEFACRAGTSTRYWSGDNEADVLRVGWTNENSKGKVHPVGDRPSDAEHPFGLRDMHGNVWEWCQDDWHETAEGAPSDGSAWCDEASEGRVFRGGSFGNPARLARSAARRGSHASLVWGDVGFRPARSAPHN